MADVKFVNLKKEAFEKDRQIQKFQQNVDEKLRQDRVATNQLINNSITQAVSQIPAAVSKNSSYQAFSFNSAVSFTPNSTGPIKITLCMSGVSADTGSPANVRLEKGGSTLDSYNIATVTEGVAMAFSFVFYDVNGSADPRNYTARSANLTTPTSGFATYRMLIEEI